MGRLIYLALASLDGYVADESGQFGWAAPDEEVHGFINELMRPVGTYLYGRRMYDVMGVWETVHEQPDVQPHIRDFAELWRAADKVVYSRTLTSPASARTRIEAAFDPEAVRGMKAEAGADLAIGGPELAGQAIRAGLVDEYQMFLAPVVVGGGKRALPDGARADLQLLEERRFEGGFVFLRYAAGLGTQP